MKKIALSVGMLVLLVTVAYSQGTPVAINGALGVKGNQMVNKNGIPPQLRGISLSWSLWAGKKYFNADVVHWLATDFKASVIRASMGVQPAGGYLEQPDTQRQLVVNVVDQAIKDGVYVLIDWHDHNSHLHIPQAKAFFADMAKRYAGVPNVIYELWNEPERVGWDTVKAYALQVIPEIRKFDKRGLIVVGSPHWDQDVDVAAADRIAGYSNIVYSFHFYASDKNHQDGLRAKADKAIKLGLPLFVTEWGVGESNGNGEFNLQKTQKWVNWMQQNKLSWANWNLTDKAETTAILKPGASAAGGWPAKQLTPAGAYVRGLLREMNE